MSNAAPCRDLELGRRLANGTATIDDVRAIGAWRLERRAPYLGALLARTSADDPEMRRAATAALREVTGVPGVRALVSA
ncbi:MAG TPA: hypothetical protein VK427_22235, partial [Kofleriaceae bacterium]|nr:hypothetical protein [Kofleriaceae bacterium]